MTQAAETPAAPSTSTDGEASVRDAAATGFVLPLTALALSMLLSSLGISSPNVALPELATAFSAPLQAVQWVIIAYLLAVTVLIVSAGRLGDVYGHRRVLIGGLVVFSLASLLCGLAPNLPVLIGARALQGAGASVLMALTVAMVRDTVPKEKTGSAMGLLGTMSAIGTALGPSLGGLLVAGPGWPSIFYLMVPLGALAAVLALRFLPADRPRGASEGFDPLGTLLLALALGAYALAVTGGGGELTGLTPALILAALIGFGLFLFAETAVRSPLVSLPALRDPRLAASLVMNILVSTVMMATLVVGPFFLAIGLGLSVTAVGLVLAVGPLVSTLSGIPAGRIVDRFGAGAIVAAGLLQVMVGALALAFAPVAFGLPGYVVAIALLTPGYQLFQAANNTAVMMDVDAGRRGVISGLLSLSRNLGLITGAALMGAIFARVSGPLDTADAAQAAGFGLTVTFCIAAALALLALLVALASGIAARAKRPPASTGAGG